jgi:hypothetical protein
VSSTRKKLLRQGRGAGFLAALDAGRSASADLLDCVLNDPRWDRQVEARDDYYARLLISTGADIHVLRQRVAEEDNEADEADFWLPIGVLAEMCRRGEPSARSAVAEAVETGARWRACLDALDAAGGVELISQVVSAETVQALIARVGIDDIADAASVVAAPWESWAEHVPTLRFVVRNCAASAREARPMSGHVAWAAPRIRKPQMAGNLAALSTKSLLAQGSTPGAASDVSDELACRTDPETLSILLTAAESGTSEERHVALRTLGKHGSVEFVSAAEQFLRQESTHARTERREHRLHQGYLRYLEELPPAHTLPLARRWFCEPWPLSLAAELILARHATPDDRQMLEAEGAAALASTDMYRLCSIVDGLSIAGPDDSLPFLSQVYEHAPYSRARHRVVSAMSDCSLAGPARAFLTETLWDCEPKSRELACRAVDTSNDLALDRIREMASDACEDEHVREAARGVLEHK